MTMFFKRRQQLHPVAQPVPVSLTPVAEVNMDGSNVDPGKPLPLDEPHEPSSEPELICLTSSSSP